MYVAYTRDNHIGKLLLITHKPNVICPSTFSPVTLIILWSPVDFLNYQVEETILTNQIAPVSL